MSKRYVLETDGDFWGHQKRVYDSYDEYYDDKYYWERAGHGTNVLRSGEAEDDD